MSRIISIVISFCCFFAAQGLQEQGWRGIVPLHSTREDVERTVGQPMSNGTTYDLKNERVTVDYSDGSCEHGAKWNVLPDRVINIRAYLKTKVMLSDLQLDLNRFEKFDNSHNRTISYTSEEQGISVSTNPKDEVFLIEYFPKSSEIHLRCPTIPRPLTNEELQSYKFDEYSSLTRADENARLDNFAARLEKEPKSKAYIMVYGKEPAASARTNRAKEYLMKRWQIASERIETRIGGNARKVSFELYLVPEQK